MKTEEQKVAELVDQYLRADDLQPSQLESMFREAIKFGQGFDKQAPKYIILVQEGAFTQVTYGPFENEDQAIGWADECVEIGKHWDCIPLYYPVERST